MIEYRRGSRFVEGGNSELYLGVAVGHGGFERRVVLKAVRAELEFDSAQRGRLAGEARLLSQLHHPGVIRISDFVEIQGRSYQVLEYLDGQDLRSWAARAEVNTAPFQDPVVSHVIRQLALTLEYVHGARDHEARPLAILHRDVSPGNVVLTHAGEVKLVDFGIARWRDQESLTKLGETAGTPGFMAPEQLTGGPQDARADVFSLACLAHWMLSGESPAAGRDEEARLLAGQPIDLSPRIPPTWRALLARGLEPSPARRFSSAGAMAVALAQMSSPQELQTEDAVRAWVSERHSGSLPAVSPADLWRVGGEITGSMELPAAISDRPPTALALAPEATVATVPNARPEPRGSFVRPSTLTRPDDFTQDSEVGTDPDEATESKGPAREAPTARGLSAAPSYLELTGPGPMVRAAEDTPASSGDTPPPRSSITPPRIVTRSQPSALLFLAMVLVVFGVAFGVSRLSWTLDPPTSASRVRSAPARERPVAVVLPPEVEPEHPTPPPPPKGEASTEVLRPPRGRPLRSAPNITPPTSEEATTPASWAPPIIAWSVERALEDKGLPKDGLDWVDAQSAAHWRGCLRARDATCLESLGPKLISAIESTAVDTNFLTRQLEALEAALGRRVAQFQPTELEALDRRLLDLKLLARQNPDRRQLRRALQEVRSIQQRLSAKAR